ncbi:hypothetical protein PpBr36_03916 [Pyricularia pennisetigena]|uniref:hypothetical protein n=1 Tax=Pyricularia pennisetigena TaxID=1578925 RepID=UPI001151F5BC|nr:hypothetical protein PpBr36_03916 [Pyricularia pennisetigena]TLS30739.1 hypothetical protein PpBr36_03916 [Pyricularia pennisetigena]
MRYNPEDGKHATREVQRRQPQVPKVGHIDKLGELVYLGLTRLQVVLLSTRLAISIRGEHSSSSPSWSGHKFGPLSAQGLFNSHYIEPMFLWWGMNTRILLGPSVGRVPVRDSFDKDMASCINGASHNYAGSYGATERSEAIHRLCLDELPVTLDSGPLYDAAREELAAFWSADFCIPTTTGYGSNYLAMPRVLALLRQRGDGVAVFCDEHCHNSIFTGVFLGMGQLGGVSLRRFSHNDAAKLEELLRDSTAPVKLVVVEGLYSMEGDVPPLRELARLKDTYGFVLYCDEAHSFLSLGKTGRGCLEYARDRGLMSTPDPVDLRTWTLSKAVGGIGGCIAGRAEFASCFVDVPPQPVSAATLVQALWVIRQPGLVRQNLARLSATAEFCRRELTSRGVFVYGGLDEATPVVPVWTGTSSTSARFSYELRRRGVLASPVTTPAVPFWESRVRVNLSADFDADDADRLVCAIVDAARATGVIARSSRRKPATAAAAMFRIAQDNKQAVRSGEEDEEPRAASDSIETLIRQQAQQQQQPQRRSEPLTLAGHAARGRYGVASGGSRWISGTFPPHVSVEGLIAAAAGAEAAMTFQDVGVSLASAIAALARPLLGAKRHVMLFPSRPDSRCVEEGLLLIPPGAVGSSRLRVVRYADVGDLARCAAESGAPSKNTCATVYLELTDSRPVEVVRAAVDQLVRQVGDRTAVTVLVRDARTPKARPEIAHIRQLVPRGGRVHALLFGTCVAADVEVGYLAGPENLIRELRYTSRGYMYTTSMPPFVVDMMVAALEGRMVNGV